LNPSRQQFATANIISGKHSPSRGRLEGFPSAGSSSTSPRNCCDPVSSPVCHLSRYCRFGTERIAISRLRVQNRASTTKQTPLSRDLSISPKWSEFSTPFYRESICFGGNRPMKFNSLRIDRIATRFMFNAETVARPIGVRPFSSNSSVSEKCSNQWS
jgi:hypothetical protein